MHTRTTRRQFRLQRQTFSIWRPCWRPYWISRFAIIYSNLCRQLQKLQTIGNILIYDASCCTGGSGLPLERVASFTHCHPTIGDPVPRLFKPFGFVKKHGRQGAGLIFPIYLYRKTWKNLLVRNHWTDFIITWQKCFLGDLLPRLFK